MFVLPINRDSGVENPPRAVIGLIIINSICLLATYATGSPAAVLSHYGFIPAQPSVSSWFTSIFLHAGFVHLIGNMWFLWMFGQKVENTFGPWLFSLVYFLSGLGATVLHASFNQGSTIPCVGASGAISGIVGCFFVLFPDSDFDLLIYFGWIRLKKIETHTHAAVGAWIGEQAILGLLTQAVDFSTVAFWAHVGGFLVGFAAAFYLRKYITATVGDVPVHRPWFKAKEAEEAEEAEEEHLAQLKL
jgi:membrane associated rhomboid family serine protease